MLTELDKGEPSSRASRMVTNGTRSGGTPQAGTSAAHKTRTNGGPVVTQGQNYYSHSREEVTRILIQALNDLGYNAAADIVGQESGYRVETPEVVAFRQAVLEGSWSRAEELLCGKTVRGSGPASGSGLGLAPGADRNLMRFWLRQQKFLELLERRETARALGVLRGELTPLCADQHHTLHLLSRLLMCQDADDLKSKANWDGVNGKSRQKLLDQLSQFISPAIMLPDHRLSTLLDDLKRGQVDRCLYHTSAESPSLYSNHYCDRSHFPTELLADLLTPGAESSKKQIEVWQVCFSPDGKWLASCGSGDSVCIWDVQHLSIRQQLNGPHKGGVGNIAWSPDSRLLISCGIDRVARIWDTDLGECVVTIDGFLEPVSSCVWAADGQSVIIGSFDKTQPLSQWDLAGNLVHMWADTYRTGGVGLSTDQRWLVAMDDQRTLHLYNFLTREHVYDMPLTDRPTSVSISHDSRHILVNKADHEALLIDIEAREIVQKYMGQIGGEFTIRSDFGGANESFVISGSQDGRIFIWHKITGGVIHSAEAHHSSCNAVAWNPADTCMFATGGDDGRIRIWSNRERVARSILPSTTTIPATTARTSNGTSRSASNGNGHYSEDMWA